MCVHRCCAEHLRNLTPNGLLLHFKIFLRFHNVALLHRIIPSLYIILYTVTDFHTFAGGGWRLLYHYY